MKNVLKLAVLIFILWGNQICVLAQEESAFGLKGGLNLTSLNVDDPEASYDSRTGYQAGIFMRERFRNVGIQPEILLFTQRGKGRSSLGTFEENFTYLSIPVIFKFYPVAGLNFQVGPQFGFLLDGEQKYESALGTFERDIKDSYKETDVAVSIGGGYDFGFGLGLDVRYNIGVKDINDASDGEEARSRIFLVSLGWNFLK